MCGDEGVERGWGPGGAHVDESMAWRRGLGGPGWPQEPGEGLGCRGSEGGGWRTCKGNGEVSRVYGREQKRAGQSGKGARLGWSSWRWPGEHGIP